MLEYLITHSPLFYFIQSLWRDEAFSVLFARQPLWEIFSKTSFEPPLYYILLHFWMMIFGTGEIAIRSLSLLGFLLACVVVIEWSQKLFRTSWLSWFTPLFFFLNPMLLYYAFEVRAYGWYMFFATCSLYAYHQKKWRLFALSTLLGVYTHSYMVLLPLVLAVHYVFTYPVKTIVRKPVTWVIHDPFVRATGFTALLSLPFLINFLSYAKQLKTAWYYPVDLHLIRSVLGNMFLGYEGTPWYLWPITAYITNFLLVFFVLTLIPKKNRKTSLLFFSVIFLPLIIVIGISFIKPLFVNRYLIFVTISQVLLFCYGLSRIAWKRLSVALGLVSCIAVIGFDCWYPLQHKKLDIRKTVFTINALKKDTDFIYVNDTLLLFETIYYAKDKQKVRLYNPNLIPFPWYVGDIIVTPDLFASEYPEYPSKAFVIQSDASYSIVSTMVLSRKK